MEEKYVLALLARAELKTIPYLERQTNRGFFLCLATCAMSSVSD